MVVSCPGCGKQHNVSEKLAGKRAKCSCGTVIEIPAVPAQPTQPVAPVQPTTPVQQTPVQQAPIQQVPAQDPLFDQSFPTESDPFAQQPAAPFQQPQLDGFPDQTAQPFGAPMPGQVPQQPMPMQQQVPVQQAPMQQPMAGQPMQQQMVPGQAGAMPSEPLICEFRYGRPPVWFWPLLFIAFFAGVWCIYTGFFDNDDWAINNHPMPPWAATLFFESIGLVAFLTTGYFFAGYIFQISHPRRVAMTQSSLILPKGTFSSTELVVPWPQASYKLEESGNYTNLTIKHPAGKVRLLQILFPSFEHFEQFLRQLRQRAPQY